MRDFGILPSGILRHCRAKIAMNGFEVEIRAIVWPCLVIACETSVCACCSQLPCFDIAVCGSCFICPDVNYFIVFKVVISGAFVSSSFALCLRKLGRFVYHALS